MNTALPAIAADLDADLADLQWVMSGYLLTLGALLVVGGSLGDLFGRRRMYLVGLVSFAVASVMCGVAPDIGLLIAARVPPGRRGRAPGAREPGDHLGLVPHRGPRRAIGSWSGLGGVATAIGPFLGGWLIDSVSWRLVFLINVPLVVVTIAITIAHVPETRDVGADHRVDVVGGLVLALGLAGVVYALIEGPNEDWSGASMILGILGLVLLAGWVLVERRSTHPMVPLEVFRSRQFSGANIATFLVYAAIGATFFLLVVHLQTDLGYSALEAGASLLPITAILLAFSTRAGALAQRIGPRLPMTVGPCVIAAGMLLLSRAEAGSSYVQDVLPGVVVVGAGLAINLAPLTTAVLAAIEDRHAGVASAINNAVARLAGLLADRGGPHRRRHRVRLRAARPRNRVRSGDVPLRRARRRGRARGVAHDPNGRPGAVHPARERRRGVRGPVPPGGRNPTVRPTATSAVPSAA